MPRYDAGAILRVKWWAKLLLPFLPKRVRVVSYERSAVDDRVTGLNCKGDNPRVTYIFGPQARCYRLEEDDDA